MVFRTFLESNGIHQMKNDNFSAKTRRDTEISAKGQLNADLETSVVKRSVKTSGIEDNEVGSVATKN